MLGYLSTLALGFFLLINFFYETWSEANLELIM